MHRKDCLAGERVGAFFATLLLDLLSSVLLLLLLLASTSGSGEELSVEQSPIANDLMHHD